MGGWSCWNAFLHTSSISGWDLMGSSSALADPGDLGLQGAQEVLKSVLSPSAMRELQGECNSKPLKWNEFFETGSSLSFLPPLTTFLLLTQTNFVFYFLKYIYMCINTVSWQLLFLSTCYFPGKMGIW